VTTLRNIVSRGSVQAFVAVALVGTLCYLAIDGKIDGPTFLTVAILPVAALFNKATSKSE
jgi:hypothetical protein